jgi:hypothetical protein
MVSTNSIFAEAAKNTSNALLNKENTQSILNKLATLLANPSLTDAERAALQKEYDYYNNAYSNAFNQYNTSINDENNIRKSQSELNLDKFGGYSKDFDLGLGGIGLNMNNKTQSELINRMLDFGINKSIEWEQDKLKIKTNDAALLDVTKNAKNNLFNTPMGGNATDTYKKINGGQDTFNNPKQETIKLDKSFLHWDAKNGGYGYESQLGEIIANHMEPKQKHAYMGEFPAGLTNLDWLVRTMDRPKIDIESVEQIRNNVKRYYPVKYSFGDLSLTFWDDIHNKTIKTIDDYFNNQVWQHDYYKNTGSLLLRDRTIIPEFHIYDLVPGTNAEPVKYTFYNAILASYDFDAQDTDDEGIHTIQVVFKIESYKLTYGAMPRTLNIGNNPKWL